MGDDLQDLPHDRRAMFRLGLRKLMQPLAEYIEQRVNLPLPICRTVLRPPGAIPEREFLDTCYRCGNCVDICPARAIRPVSNGDVEGAGTPYIDPDLAACVVCDELSCMSVCPSGALKAVSAPNQIRMGVARLDVHLCTRSRGEDCRICVEKCPFGSEAIQVSDTGVVSVQPGCVGCGSCQFYCPTMPKAITIEPV